MAATGDALFEQSLGAAKIKHDETLKDLQDKRNWGRLTERLIEVKTGTKDTAKAPTLDELPQQWSGTRHKRGHDSQYVKECMAILQRFVAFLKANHPTAKELLLVTAPMAKAFMQAEQSRPTWLRRRRGIPA